MSPHLQRLPGEIRNKIYEYALTQDDGVWHYKDKHGTRWLCLHSQEEGGIDQGESSDKGLKEDDMDLSGPADDCEGEETQDGVAVKLRWGDNDRSSEGAMIDVHCLQHTEPTQACHVPKEHQMADTYQADHEYNSEAKVVVEGHTVANQLQFVNRQLRQETKGLTLRWNVLQTFLSSLAVKSSMKTSLKKRLIWS